ncbi:MAG: hypothetical protein LC641_10745 [Spirochaeta sp.]|nr:hypothetical protein [Spirochaeta sp.]
MIKQRPLTKRRPFLKRQVVCAAVGALMLMTAGVAAASVHVPPSPGSSLGFESHLRGFWHINNWNPLLSLGFRAEDDLDQLYKSLTLGSYYRLHPNLKVGAFYRLQQGARHDDDWVASGSSFTWEDSTWRTEHVFYGDISPRFLLPWMPGRDWVFLLKARYFYSTYNQHQWFQVRPGLTYFWIVDRKPVLNVSLQYEWYLPLNFSESTIYAHWPYFTVLYHLTPEIGIDASLGYRTLNWSTSEDVSDDPDHGDYSKRVRTWMIGLGAVFRFSP